MIRALTLAALCLGGCSAVDMTTTVMLSRLNPLAADPADFMVVITLPPGLGLEPDSASLGLEATFRDQAVSERYLLRQTGLSDGGIALAVKPEDLPQMRIVKDKVAGWEAEFPRESSGSLTASVTPCLTGIPLTDDATVSISIRTSPDGPLMPLMHPYSARKLAARIESDAGASLSECGVANRR